MTPPQPSRYSFWWQGLLILLPLVALAGFSLFTLQRDRLLVENEARSTATVAAQQLQRAVSEALGARLESYRQASATVATARDVALGLEINPASAGADATASLSEWQRTHPETDLTNLPACESEFVESDSALFSSFNHPRIVPEWPQPPAWVTHLTVEQAALWTQIELCADTNFCAEVGRQFQALQPSAEALTNLQFRLWELAARDVSAETAFVMARDGEFAFSETATFIGLPLGHVACLRALRALPAASEFPEDARAWIAHAALRNPSVLTPRLIEEVQRRATVAQQDFATALVSHWQSDELTRAIRGKFLEMKSPNETNAARWIQIVGQGDWFVTQHSAGMATITNNDVVENTPLFQQRIFPTAFVGRAIRQAVGESGVWLPPYGVAVVQLAGRQINVTTGELQPRAKLDLPLLAESEGGALRMPAPALEYPLGVQLYLLNRETMMSRHRQRTLWSGAIILCAAIAAAIGLVAAWRSFRRQLALNELKSNFVSSVSHELRAPIASVRLMAESLERGKISEPAKQNEYFHFIGQECRRLSALIENVLDFSRIDQGRKQYEFEPTDVAALVEQTVKLMEPYAAEKSVRLEHGKESLVNADGKSGSLELCVDGRALQQALVNLIDNATKHSPKGAAVVVELKAASGGLVELMVTDSGPGVPEGEREKIFERFYRLGSELRRETQGVGIGLSIVKHIVDAHGGRVRVDSVVGNGSRFTIELPVGNSHTQPGKDAKT